MVVLEYLLPPTFHPVKNQANFSYGLSPGRFVYPLASGLTDLGICSVTPCYSSITARGVFRLLLSGSIRLRSGILRRLVQVEASVLKGVNSPLITSKGDSVPRINGTDLISSDPFA